MKAKIDTDGNRIQTLAQVYHGTEPKWGVSDKTLFSRIGEAINWYSVSYDNSDFKSWALKYFKTNNFNTNFKKDVSDPDFRAFGILLRLKEKGCPFTDEWEARFQSELKKLKSRVDKPLTDAPVEKNRYDKIQATMAKRAKNAMALLEGVMDDIFTGKLKITAQSTWESLKMSIPANYMQDMFDRLDNCLEEAEEVLEAFDAKKPTETELFLRESYSNFDRQSLVIYINSLQYLQNLCDTTIKKAVVEKQATRKPKAKKPVNLDKMLERCLFFKGTMDDPKIQSKNPKQIFGADQVIIYEINKRIISVLKSSGENGLSIKGTTIIGFDENNSIRKTVRKPELLIPQILKATKPQSKNLVKEIVAKNQEVSGRLNAFTIIIRVD